MTGSRLPTRAEVLRVLGWVESRCKEEGHLCLSFRAGENAVSTRNSENQMNWDRTVGDSLALATLAHLGPLPSVGDDLI